VRVQIVAGQRENVFLVPQTAVLQNEKGYTVFALDAEGKASIRPVQTGEWVGTDWTILGGLSAGDRVVVDNLLKLQPGMKVTPAALPTPSPAPAPASAVGSPARVAK
jgi:membrane fusion protein (multidrug efflux system)